MNVKILILSFILLFFFSFSVFIKAVTQLPFTENISFNKSAEITPTIEIPKNNQYSYKGYSYDVNWFSVNDPGKLVLISNWIDKIDSSEIINNYNCVALTNAGFYTKDEKPIGYFKIGSEVFSNFTNNTIFNTVLSVTESKEIIFSRTPPAENVLFSLQSGPQIIDEGTVEDLSNIKNDRGRRILILETFSNDLFLLVIYNPDSVFDGPGIPDIAGILQSVQDRLNWKIKNALNLDGGAASVFKNDDIFLKELTFSGSFLCLKL